MPLVKINGRSINIDGPDDMPLLWALRDILGMRGTKFGCELGLCGACTVRIPVYRGTYHPISRRHSHE